MAKFSHLSVHKRLAKVASARMRRLAFEGNHQRIPLTISQKTLMDFLGRVNSEEIVNDALLLHTEE